MKIKALIQPLKDLWSLFFPWICLACGRHVRKGGEAICLYCQYKLPKTDFHTDAENPMAEHFWGRVPIQNAAAFYYFSKGTRVQRLVHQLKYLRQPQVGDCVGRLYGRVLRKSELFDSIDIIVPVPLHITRQRQRGYNQSERFANGLSYSLERPMLKALKRKVSTQTQTKKSRLDRFENVEHAFEVVLAEEVKGKHVLLVDDVITTGATLEACAIKLLECPDTKVSVVTIAFASRY